MIAHRHVSRASRRAFWAAWRLALALRVARDYYHG